MGSSEVPFFWSLRRHRLWEQCRRAYALNYYGARGGHDPDAPAECRELHHRRRLMEKTSYLRTLLGNGMYQLYYAPAETDSPLPERLESVVLPALEREFRRMLSGAAFLDHKLPLLAELLTPECRPETLLAELRTEACRLCTLLEEGCWGEFRRIPVERRRLLPFPLPLQVGELLCYAAPLLAAEMHGEFWIVERGRDAGCDFVAVLHRFYAMNVLGRDPEKVHSFYLADPDWELKSAGDSPDVSAVLRQLREESAAMSALSLPGSGHWQDVPGTPGACAGCVFRDFCRNL